MCGGKQGFSEKDLVNIIDVVRKEQNRNYMQKTTQLVHCTSELIARMPLQNC